MCAFANGVFAIALEMVALITNGHWLDSRVASDDSVVLVKVLLAPVLVMLPAGTLPASAETDAAMLVTTGLSQSLPSLAKTTLCVCESELTAIACDGLARCGVIYVALRCPHIADGTGASRRYAEVFYTPTARLTRVWPRSSAG